MNYLRINGLFTIMMTTLLTSLSAQTVVDVHSHNVLPMQTENLASHHAELDEGFPLPHWEAEAHLQFMEDAGIGLSILTMPAPQPFFGDTDECKRVIRTYNEQSAKLKAGHPGKFAFCASLPLPDVDAAISEAIYALDTLKADGIKLATNSRGQYLGDASLEPLMKVLNERNAVIILHPHKPVPVNDSLIRTTPLAMYEYPAETTRAVINLIAHNVLVRYPNIKMVVPHCGSFLPLAIPRMKAVHPAMLKAGLMQPIDWDGNLKNLYYDLAGAPTAEVLKMLLTMTTPDHLLYGSDYPYQPPRVLKENLRKLRETLAADEQLAPFMPDILGTNALKLFTSSVAVDARSVKTDKEMLVRISEIEVYPQYLQEYLKYALTVGATSVKEEPGVICIYPMQQKRDSCQIRILEIYADNEAYKRHIASAHFQAYKKGSLHMVKSLDLVDVRPLNEADMKTIFKKMEVSFPL